LNDILSLDEAQLAEQKLNIAFSLEELRAVNNLSQKFLARQINNFMPWRLGEYEAGVGYNLQDLSKIREIVQRFPPPHPSYDYIYQDLAASLNFLGRQPERSTSQEGQRRVRSDQLAGRTAETIHVGSTLQDAQRRAGSNKRQGFSDFVERASLQKSIITQIYSGEISSVKHYLVAQQMLNTFSDGLDPTVADEVRTALENTLQKLEADFRVHRSSYISDLPAAEKDRKTRFAWLVNQAIDVTDISGDRNTLFGEDKDRHKFTNPANYNNLDLLGNIARFIDGSPLPRQLQDEALSLVENIRNAIPEARPLSDIELVSAAIARGRRDDAASETRDDAASFLASKLNPNAFRYYRNFIERLEAHAKIDTFEQVYCTNLLLNRYVAPHETLKEQLSGYRTILNRLGAQLRKERASELLSRAGLSLDVGDQRRREILRAVDIAISLRHAREIAHLTVPEVVGEINNLVRARGIAVGDENFTESNQVYYLENTTRYNLRQLGIAQLFLQVCQAPKEITTPGEALIGKAVLADLTARSRRPPSRVRRRPDGEIPPADQQTVVSDARYSLLATVRQQILADLLETGLDVDAFFPHVERLISDQERKIDADRRANLRSRLAADTALFPQLTRGIPLNEPDHQEITLRVDIALTLSKLRLTSPRPRTQQQLAEDAEVGYRVLQTIEAGAWRYLPPVEEINSVLRGLDADDQTTTFVHERITSLGELKQLPPEETEPASVPPTPAPSPQTKPSGPPPVSPREEPYDDLGIFGWLVRIHLAHRHQGLPEHQGDYIAAFARETGFDTNQLRQLLDPPSRQGSIEESGDDRPGVSTEDANQKRATNAIVRAITVYLTADKHRPETWEGQTIDRAPDDGSTIWSHIGLLVQTHAQLLSDRLDRRAIPVRGTLSSDTFKNIVNGKGAWEPSSVRHLLEHWQGVWESTQSAQPPHPEPVGPAQSPADSAQLSPGPAATTTTPDTTPAPEEPTATAKGSASPTGMPNLKRDVQGWQTYGWLHGLYREAHGLTRGAVANLIRAKEDDVARMERGEGKKINTVAAHTAALAEYLRTHESAAGLRLVDRPSSSSGWFYTGRLVRTVRRDLGESVVSVAQSHGFTTQVLEAIEKGAGGQHRTELATLLNFYGGRLERQPLERPAPPMSPGEEGRAPRGGGALPPPSPLSFRSGSPQRLLSGRRRPPNAAMIGRSR
jgi:hypothetical protein